MEQPTASNRGMATEEPPNAMNRKAGEQALLERLLHVIKQQLDKDRAMQLQALYVRLMSNNVKGNKIFEHMQSLVGSQMMRMSVDTVRRQSAGSSSLASGSNANTSPETLLQAPVSLLSKKQKFSGAFSGQSVEQHSKMEAQILHLDRISDLPPSIIQTILTLMPMRDAFRTSILSKNWRHHCLTIPNLIFDDVLFHCKGNLIRWKLFHIGYPILLLHQGPILEFSLCISELFSCCEIDQIILHLSRSTSTLKKLTLCIGLGGDHKLLPAFFNLQHLTDLKLQNCRFQPPVTFKGFSNLVSLSFNNVSVTVEVFLRFIYNCPQLKSFTLIGDEKHYMGCQKFSFVDLFKRLPLVEHLCMSLYPIKFFSGGLMPQKLPTSLIQIKHLHLLGLSFGGVIDLYSALLLVTNSPNIETIILEDNPNASLLQQPVLKNINQQDYSYVVLDHLRVIKITNFTNMKTGMDFVKLILAKSPMLKIVDIVLHKQVDVNGEVKMLKELLQYPRASTKAEIWFARP